jgi:hypothetical protein
MTTTSILVAVGAAGQKGLRQARGVSSVEYVVTTSITTTPTGVYRQHQRPSQGAFDRFDPPGII